jgi:hypothetical protein
MKKIFYSLSLFVSLILVVASCEQDNYPLPDAQFFGAIRDSVGGGLVEQDLQTGSTIGMREKGYSTEVIQNYVIKQNGEFRNNLVYASTYDIVFQSCNFFPYELPDFVVKPGPNEVTFQVVPFIRVKNCSITYDAGTNKVNATFNLEAGKPTVKLSKITLYVFTDMYVGEYIKKTVATGTGQPARTYSPAATIDPATPYTLSIDVAANSAVFGVHRNYYFRVGAMANQSGVGTIRTNYEPYVKIAL